MSPVEYIFVASIILPPCIGAVIYRVFLRLWKAGAALPAVISGMLTAGLFLWMIKASIGSCATDGEMYGLILAAICGTPIVTVIAIIFGSGVGQRKR